MFIFAQPDSESVVELNLNASVLEPLPDSWLRIREYVCNKD